MIIWNRRAETSLDKITDYIGGNFSQKEEEAFLIQVLETLMQLMNFQKHILRQKY